MRTEGSKETNADEKVELRIEALSTSISASLFHIAVDERLGFDLYVNTEEPDAITQTIIARTFVLPGDFFLLTDLMRPGSCILDLGAHIGTFSLYAAAAGYRVLSVEASPYNAALFKQSVLRNKFDSITVAETAVSDSEGTVEFIAAGPHSLIATPLLDNPRITVPTTTVDALLKAEAWEHVDFIKMDIEGAEVAAIRGMANLLSGDQAPVILYESNGYTLRMFGETPASLMASLESFGYHCYLVEGNDLMPFRSGELQIDACVDFLATKRPLQALPHWKVREPLSVREQIVKSLQACVHPHQHNREHIARALASADAAILADQRILDAVEALKYDAVVEVREAASWLATSGKPVFERLQELQRAVVERDAEIARLQELVTAYEHGRFMRFMRWLSGLWQQLFKKGM